MYASCMSLEDTTNYYKQDPECSTFLDNTLKLKKTFKPKASITDKTQTV